MVLETPVVAGWRLSPAEVAPLEGVFEAPSAVPAVSGRLLAVIAESAFVRQAVATTMWRLLAARYTCRDRMLETVAVAVLRAGIAGGAVPTRDRFVL